MAAIAQPPDQQQLPGVAPPPIMTSGQILSHVDSVYNSLPDPVKGALDHAHSLTGGGLSGISDALKPASPAPESTAIAPPPVEMGGNSMPSLTTANGPQSTTGPSAIAPPPVGSGSSITTAPAPSMAQKELSRITAPPLASDNPLAHTKSDTGRTGIGQIHNPFLRGLATVGDVVASGVFPRFGAFVPGTTAHHELLVNDAANAVGREQTSAKNAADVEHAGAETKELGARAKEEEARAEAVANPPNAKEWSQLTDPIIDPQHPENGPQIAYVNKNDPTQIKFLGKAAAKPTEDKTTSNVHVLPDGKVVAVSHDPKTGKSTAEVVYEGDPKVETDITKLKGADGKEHTVIVNKQTGATIKDLGETGEKPPVVNVNTGNAALDREINQYGKKYETMSSGVDSQLDKILDAEKMVAGGAVSQALAIPKVLTALISGQGSGVRITQAELNSLAKARGIGGDIEGWFNKLSGKGTLTDQQKNELNGLLSDVRQRIAIKKQIADEAADAIRNSGSRDEILKHVSDYDKKLSSGSDSNVTGKELPGGITIDDIDKEIQRRKGAKK